MLDVKKSVVSKLKSTGYNVYYEMFTENVSTPCITYYEENNFETTKTDAAGVSSITFIVKAWSTSVEDISKMSAAIDTKMRSLGFKRTSTNELVNNGLISRIMKFTALGFEEY